MKKKGLWLITGLMTLALLGVFVMQLYYIQESYRLKSQLFEQDVYESLEAVTNKIQKKNAVFQIDKNSADFKAQQKRDIRNQTDSIVSFKVHYKEAQFLRKARQNQEIFAYLKTQDSIILNNYLSAEIISEEDYQEMLKPSKKEGKLNVVTQDSYDLNGHWVGRNLTVSVAKPITKTPPNKLPDTLRYVAFDPVISSPRLISLPTKDRELLIKFKMEDAKAERKYQIELNRLYEDTLNVYNQRNVGMVQAVVKELENKNIPLEQRIPSKEIIDSLLKRELLGRNITIGYNYWLTASTDKNHIIYKNVSNGSPILPKNTYSKVIFGNDIITADPGMIYINFPGKSAAIFSNMFITLASSAGLLLVLISVFAYTIYAIIRQKKLSEMKTDFINNMTHEFKTPVATIMIASEALKDPEIISDKTRVNKLADIIYDENVRLGNHIERVLDIARIDKKELRLDYDTVQVNELISLVVDSMKLQLQKKNASITLDLKANPEIIYTDELHLSNVIYNLIDNANKYSINEPQIHIATQNIGKTISILISDKGIGMTKEQSKRIFDQFYRVPTGNLHNVKGFGLGLNYVYNMLAEMGGQIKVQSEKDKGTTFEVILPLKTKL